MKIGVVSRGEFETYVCSSVVSLCLVFLEVGLVNETRSFGQATLASSEKGL